MITPPPRQEKNPANFILIGSIFVILVGWIVFRAAHRQETGPKPSDTVNTVPRSVSSETAAEIRKVIHDHLDALGRDDFQAVLNTLTDRYRGRPLDTVRKVYYVQYAALAVADPDKTVYQDIAPGEFDSATVVATTKLIGENGVDYGAIFTLYKHRDEWKIDGVAMYPIVLDSSGKPIQLSSG